MAVFGFESLGRLHSDADGFPESTTAPQLHAPIASTCLCAPGTILVQGFCQVMTTDFVTMNIARLHHPIGTAWCHS